MLLRLSEDVRDCYRHAEDCAERARVAATPELRADFLRLERAWLMLAHSYEFTERLSAFDTEFQASRTRATEVAAPAASIIIH